ncbi:MAG: hypothetical protein GYA26_10780 [Flexilinea flocculi]|nr:hypothetical protein [Flexilinea flocculi]
MIIHLDLLFSPRNYLDPGTGSMLLQVIIAALAVIGGYLFMIRDRVKKIFTKKRTDETDADKTGQEEKYEEK